jgi:hypothetical protein
MHCYYYLYYGLCLGVLCGFLSSCANSQFDCREVGTVNCKRLDQVNALVDRGILGLSSSQIINNIPTAKGFSTRRQGASRRSIYQIHEDGERHRQQSRKFIREGYSYRQSKSHSYTPFSKPFPFEYRKSVKRRQNDTFLRIWFSPFEDELGHYHAQSIIYINV